jgi:ribosomal protein S18 acetylase RimI-like enzyme
MLKNANRTVVAFEGEKVVGFARALCDDVSNGYIGTVAVAEDFRRRGVGRELVERLIGDDKNITWVLRAGRGSREFWEKMGFSVSEIAMEKTRETK